MSEGPDKPFQFGLVHLLAGTAVAALFLMVLVPRRTQVFPALTLQVVDLQGDGAAAISMEYGGSDFVEKVKTDEDGSVKFPARVERLMLDSRTDGAAVSFYLPRGYELDPSCIPHNLKSDATDELSAPGTSPRRSRSWQTSDGAWTGTYSENPWGIDMHWYIQNAANPGVFSYRIVIRPRPVTVPSHSGRPNMEFVPKENGEATARER